MSAGIEMMVKALLKAAGIDVQDAKKTATDYVHNFQHEAASANARLDAIELNVKAICEFHGIEYKPAIIPPHPSTLQAAE
jgi:hypothetical protein